jgi:flagellin-like hook-associated protein FlgL
MESLSLSRSVVNNLNSAFEKHAKINRHLQTGKRVLDPADDVGEASKLGKTKLDLIKNRNIQSNLQNSLSLLQAQDGMYNTIGDILSRSSELKTLFSSPVAGDQAKAAYNQEFQELQHELRAIAKSKWNGISLFSTQDSRTLFGPAVDTEDMHQQSSDKAADAPLKLSRWGIYQFEEPEIEQKTLDKKLLAITFTDESQGGPDGYWSSNDQYDPADPGTHQNPRSGVKGGNGFHEDLENWKDYTSLLGIEADIALVVNQVSDFINTNTGNHFFEAPTGSYADGGHVLPKIYDNETTSLEQLANAGLNVSIHRGAGRDNMNKGPLPTGAVNPRNPANQADFLYSIFQEKTNNGSELPDAIGIFVDNSGSLTFPNVNQGLFLFIDRIRTEYPNIILPSSDITQVTRDDPGDDPVDVINFPEGEDVARKDTGIYQGISLAGKEDWINQSKLALQNLIASDPGFQEALTPEEVVEDPTYDLSSYSISDLNSFFDSLIEARAENASEQQRIRSEMGELQQKQVGLEEAVGASEDLDVSAAMGVFHRTKDQVDLNAQLVSAAKEMENILYTDFL